MRDNIADIICIGAQKAATSWLHHVLAAHPMVYAFPNTAPLTSSIKEAHYWDRNQDLGLAWYRTLMTPPDDPARMSIDVTPEYALLDADQIAACKAASPKARVIYILRDPLCRMISALRMHTRRLTNEAAPETLRLELDDTLMRMAQAERVLQHCAYVGNHARWVAAYPDMLVLNYEDIRTDPAGVIDRVLAHCALPRSDLPQAARAVLDQRLRDRIWTGIPYDISPEAVLFLRGLVWERRIWAQKRFGFTFHEGDTLRNGGP